MSYAIATAFMSLFEVSVGTLLQCYLIDELTNEKPLYADSEMTTVLHWYAQQLLPLIYHHNILFESCITD